jgi:hypothetical protein
MTVVEISQCSADFGVQVDQWQKNRIAILAPHMPLHNDMVNHSMEKKRLTLFKITSYAEMRSVATKSSVCSSISKISRTLPDAIFLMLYWLRSTLVTAVSEDILNNIKRV